MRNTISPNDLSATEARDREQARAARDAYNRSPPTLETVQSEILEHLREATKMVATEEILLDLQRKHPGIPEGVVHLALLVLEESDLIYPKPGEEGRRSAADAAQVLQFAAAGRIVQRMARKWGRAS